MLTSWLTFAVMILIQVAAAAAIVSSIKTTLAVHTEEIDKLREFKHDWNPKAMILNDHTAKLDDHEERIRDLEKHHVTKRAG